MSLNQKRGNYQKVKLNSNYKARIARQLKNLKSLKTNYQGALRSIKSHRLVK